MREKRKALWADPVYREMMTKKRISANNNPEIKARRAATLKATWEKKRISPEYLANVSKKPKAEWMRKRREEMRK